MTVEILAALFGIGLVSAVAFGLIYNLHIVPFVARNSDAGSATGLNAITRNLGTYFRLRPERRWLQWAIALMYFWFMIGLLILIYVFFLTWQSGSQSKPNKAALDNPKNVVCRLTYPIRILTLRS